MFLYQAEIGRQDARLKMERENLGKEKSVLMETASNQDNQDGALEITAIDSPNEVDHRQHRRSRRVRRQREVRERRLFAKENMVMLEIWEEIEKERS
ncbi:hypothetical protein ACH5RR_002524 [Cinchona calisaya]|uniref:Uncharacterized protein n=1 Tax=Cinchona calisaya TaxID=153742 RepID=A0ABD3B750_9GENT